VSPFRFDFKSKDGKQLKRGLYTGASKYSELDVGNGIEISGEGRTCKKIK